MTHIASRDGTQSRHPQRNRSLLDPGHPQWLQTGISVDQSRIKRTESRLTEGHRAGYLARECLPVAPRRVACRHHRGDQERVRTERLDLEDLVRVLHDLPQSDRLLQLRLPLVPRRSGFRKDGVQAAKSAVVVNCAWED